MTRRGRAPLACCVIASFVAVAEAQSFDSAAQELAREPAVVAPTPRAASERARESSRVRLDGVAAVVGGEAPGAGTVLLLRSDVELRARLALLRSGSLQLALSEVPESVLAASLSELLGEALIALEARRLNLARPSAEARAEERKRLIDDLGADGSQLLAAFGVSDRELAIWIERRAVVSAFLAANLEGTLDVSNMELERLFRSEPHPFRDAPFEEARERFAEWLTRDRMTQAVRRWVETLTARTPHRVLARYVSSTESDAR